MFWYTHLIVFCHNRRFHHCASALLSNCNVMVLIPADNWCLTVRWVASRESSWSKSSNNLRRLLKNWQRIMGQTLDSQTLHSTQLLFHSPRNFSWVLGAFPSSKPDIISIDIFVLVKGTLVRINYSISKLSICLDNLQEPDCKLSFSYENIFFYFLYGFDLERKHVKSVLEFILN